MDNHSHRRADPAPVRGGTSSGPEPAAEPPETQPDPVETDRKPKPREGAR